MDAFLRVLLLEDYNTRLVVIGTVCLGIGLASNPNPCGPYSNPPRNN